jgi:3-methyladenine DNA glycosylase AlkC
MKPVEVPRMAAGPIRVRRDGGGRRISDLPPDLVVSLSMGERETATWTEWMAVDTGQLTVTVAGELPLGRLRQALVAVSPDLAGKGILDRLKLVGQVVACAVDDFDDPGFRHLASHRSDAVRQWCAYAASNHRRVRSLASLLTATLPFAADSHMSVRECAWMAFRPRLIAHLNEGLHLLTEVAQSPDPRVRRFAVESSRPRSVWGQHCTVLKAHPELGRPILEVVRAESNRYTQLSVGHWLNDASKSRPDWVQGLSDEWSRDGNMGTNWMARRGLRTLRSRAAGEIGPNSRVSFHHSTLLGPGGD